LIVDVAGNDGFQRALASLRTGDLKAAEHLLKAVLDRQAGHVGALNVLGIVLTQLGRLSEAEIYLRRALKAHADSDATLSNYGIVLKKLNRPAEALACFTQALTIAPAVAETWNNRGTVLNDLKRHDEAVADFERAVALNPGYAEAHCNKAKSLTLLNRLDEAVATFDAALALKPDFADAWYGRGHAFWELKRYSEALAAFDKALALAPTLAEAWLGRGNVFAQLKRHDDAVVAYDRALALHPGSAAAWLGRGNVLTDRKRLTDASAAFSQALTLDPDLAEAWLGRGNVFMNLGKYDDAAAAYDRALTFRPNLAEAWFARGQVLGECNRHGEAFASYDRAAALAPDLSYLAGDRLFAKLSICHWKNFEAEAADVLTGIRQGKASSAPFPFLAVQSSSADQLQCAKRYVQDRPVFAPVWRGEAYEHDRIRIAYLSADFRGSAMAHLLAGLFEQHDKSRFEIAAISFGPDQDSPMRQRLKDAFEHFIDVRDSSDEDIAALVRAREIDIAVDLMGFTRNNRLEILARRAAPVQVNYLGFPGTLGADCIDYIIADPTTIPASERRFFSEKTVWLPEPYFVADNKFASPDRAPTRQQCGLPDDAFVFCCFNNNYKITPEIFAIWMRLLKANGNSVLWLLEGNPVASANLRREAGNHGVPSERLIFAPRMTIAEHLARHRHADLFLDTLPINAHTTASDALWTGLPIVTCPGSTLVGRVAASLLKATGLDELIVSSLEEYEALALKLARQPELLRSLKSKLTHNRVSSPLFDSERFARTIEAAYVAMWQRHQQGHAPAAFQIEPAIQRSVPRLEE
jgi:predicted O-linked N-acetylglucosamine transferase (SPINDLY family)